jgi:hypothetical protein
MIMHAFKDYHFLELQDENGDIVGYTVIELFDHLMDQYIQPEDKADQITALHKILEQSYDSNEEPQVYYKSVQDAKNSPKLLNEIIDESTLIRHGLNQFKENINLKADVKAWKTLSPTEKTWKKFKSLFTKAINENKNDAGTLKAIGITNAVKEQDNQNKENQRVLAQAMIEANDKIEQLEKQQAQLYAALMAKQPPVAPLQDTTAATIKALTDESGGNGGTGRGQYIKSGGQNFPANGKDGTRIARRWDNDNYCWTCGFDIKHTSETCKYIKDTVNHRKEATATNTMNGSIRNLHLRA